MLILSILALESAHPVRFLYRHFLSSITKKSLNAFYYVCSYAKIDSSVFMNVTAQAALRLNSLKSQQVFICVDDNMVTKFGKKFENVSTLFDHAAHNGSNYLNGYCLVSLMLCISVWNHDKIIISNKCLKTGIFLGRHIIYKVVKWCYSNQFIV